jgi:hypothetical protein
MVCSVAPEKGIFSADVISLFVDSSGGKKSSGRIGSSHTELGSFRSSLLKDPNE